MEYTITATLKIPMSISETQVRNTLHIPSSIDLETEDYDTAVTILGKEFLNYEYGIYKELSDLEVEFDE